MSGETKICMEYCLRCMAACEHCAVSCLQETHSDKMKECIRMDMQCAVLCRTTAEMLAMDSEFSPYLCKLCADVCEKCGHICSQHEHDHCQKCAKACHECAEKCHQIAMIVQ